MTEPLAVYLTDHLGGAQVAVQLLEAMRDQHDEERYRKFAESLLPEIQQDDDTLRRIIAAIAEEPSTIKNVGGWLLEKMTRLKLGHTRSLGLEMFESLEVLSLGIAGKRSLWKALQKLSVADARLREFDFARLLDRAEDQFQTVERERLTLVPQVLILLTEKEGTPEASKS